MGKYVTVAMADNTVMQAYHAVPETAGNYPAILLLQEAFGVNHYMRTVAERIALEGYVVITPELFHRTQPGFEGSYDNFEAVQPHIRAITNEGLEADIKACYNWLQEQSNVVKNKVASVGFCMGGRVAYLANTVLPLAAAVSYYGSNIHTLLDRLDHLSAPQLFFWGGQDKHIGKDQIAAVVKGFREKNKAFINVEISYADHGFNCDERPSYSKDAATEAWQMTLAFLKNKLVDQ